ncbi:MAG: hypothetical protein JXP34_26305 [Planctomycetes bacterium]|nr:hypothetical protein [Planctomycetota bacterium]
MLRRRFPLPARWIGLLGLLVIIAIAPSRAGQIWPSDDGGLPVDVYTANDAVYVSGELDMTPEDFIFPSARVYVTADRAWTLGDAAVDVTAGGHNVVTGTMLGGGFLGEIVWLPMLTPGTYDILLDENQNGVYDGIDAVVGEVQGQYAFRVTGATGPPTIDVAKVKGNAQRLADGYRRALPAAMVAATAVSAWSTAYSFALMGASPIYCGVAGVVAYFVATDYNSAVMSVGFQVIADLAGPLGNHYQSLANDPPDPDFQVPVLLAARTVASPKGSSALEAAEVLWANRMAEQAALVAALTSALEKYQGAAAAEDDAHTMAQAAAAKGFADLLAANLDATEKAIAQLAAEIEKIGADRAIDADEVRAFQSKIAATGFTDEEKARAREAGMTDDEIAALAARIRDADLTDLADGSFAALLQGIRDETIAALPAVQTIAADAQEVVDHFAATVPSPVPVARPGGPYSGDEGSPVSLDGSASSDPEGESLTYAWDLDGDGAFDDATGAEVQRTWGSEFAGYVGLRVENVSGASSAAWAWVEIRSINAPPAIRVIAPQDRAVRVAAGGSVAFEVEATDPDGDPVGYSWDVDGSEVASAPAWTFEASSLGIKEVTLAVSDGSPLSADAIEIWRIIVDSAPPPVPFKRGDVNADGNYNIADAVFTLTYIFASGPAPTCLESADSDDGGTLDIGDAVYLLNHQFADGPAPAEPFAACGTDTDDEGLGCAAFDPCEET